MFWTKSRSIINEGNCRYYNAQLGISCFQPHGLSEKNQSTTIRLYITLSVLNFIDKFGCRNVSHKCESEPLLAQIFN